jgi:hypothetical protein
MGWEKIFDILNWAKDKLPIQNRIERWKNEIDKLERERAEILIHKADVKSAKRLAVIDDKLKYYNGLCKNSTDSK